jgi:cell division protease FtsH
MPYSIKIQHTILLGLLICTPVLKAKDDKEDKPTLRRSWLRPIRDILAPVLSDHALENYERKIKQHEGLLQEDDPASLNGNTVPSGVDNSPVPVSSFKDIAGGVPEDIISLLDILKGDKRYKERGVTPPKGILLVGPPGTGKTLLARALAGEAHCPFKAATATQFIELYVGQGAARVRELFGQAKAMAHAFKTYAIIFIDEIDAIGNRSSIAGHDTETTRTLNELLNQMDGFASNDEIIVLAATNNPQRLDAALKRSGRFDTIIEIPLPDKEKRVAILKHYLSRVPKGGAGPNLSVEPIAERTKGLSPSDLEELVRKAGALSIQEKAPYIQQKHLETAADSLMYKRKF